MRFADLQTKLQNLTKSEVSMYQLAKMLNTSTSKIKYRRDHNIGFSQEEMQTIFSYLENNCTNNCIKNVQNIIPFPADRVEIGYWSELPEELKKPKISSVWFDREIIENDWKMSAEHLCVMPMIGDKMSNYWYPIKSGDMLIIDTTQNHIIGNGVYFATSRNNAYYWIREMQRLFNESVEFKGYAPSGNTTKTLTLEQLQEADFRLIGKVIKNVSFRL